MSSTTSSPVNRPHQQPQQPRQQPRRPLNRDPDYTEFGIKIHKLRLTLKVQRRASSERNHHRLQPDNHSRASVRPRASSSSSSSSLVADSLRMLDLDPSAGSRRPVVLRQEAARSSSGTRVANWEFQGFYSPPIRTSTPSSSGYSSAAVSRTSSFSSDFFGNNSKNKRRLSSAEDSAYSEVYSTIQELSELPDPFDEEIPGQSDLGVAAKTQKPPIASKPVGSQASPRAGKASKATKASKAPAKATQSDTLKILQSTQPSLRSSQVTLRASQGLLKTSHEHLGQTNCMQDTLKASQVMMQSSLRSSQATLQESQGQGLLLPQTTSKSMSSLADDSGFARSFFTPIDPAEKPPHHTRTRSCSIVELPAHIPPPLPPRSSKCRPPARPPYSSSIVRRVQEVAMPIRR